jgi:hypothetical protein
VHLQDVRRISETEYQKTDLVNRFEGSLYNKHTAVRSICHHGSGDNKFPYSSCSRGSRFGYLTDLHETTEIESVLGK